MSRLLAKQHARDTPSRRHHYVPQSYLRQWSEDGKRIWALDTVTQQIKRVGISGVCVEENFYRVMGADAVPHNRVELMFGVVDNELRRLQRLFNELEDTESLVFDDLISLGVTIAVQRMRTLQQRRLRQQYNAWLVAQNSRDFQPLEDDAVNPHRVAGFHTKALFSAMWEAADHMTLRQIEVWHDPKGRFITCDAPILVPFERNVRPGINSARYVIWPIGPHRAIALSDDHEGVKAVVREATGKLVGVAQKSVLQGRERMIFSSEEQLDRLPGGKKFRRRAQIRLRCSRRSPNGRYIDPPGCCVEYSETFAEGPDIVLCDQGLHTPAPAMWAYR
jgi:hypothetical protein